MDCLSPGVRDQHGQYRETDRSKGFGFVEMDDANEGQKAIDALNEKEIGGRTLRVNEARPRD